jgi:hypothetical protein
VKVVGAGEALGNWNPKDAPAMEWQEGDVWETTLALPSGSPVEFKLVVTNQGGSSAVWEGGSNRLFTIPSSSSSSQEGILCGSNEETAAYKYLLACQWANPSASLEQTGPEAIATDDDEGEVDARDMRGDIDGYETDDEGKVVVSDAMTEDEPTEQRPREEVGKMTVEGSGPEGYPSTSTKEAEIKDVGKMEIAEGGDGVEDRAAAELETQSIEPTGADELENPISQVLNNFLQARCIEYVPQRSSREAVFFSLPFIQAARQRAVLSVS